jgi:hypothetical protein
MYAVVPAFAFAEVVQTAGAFGTGFSVAACGEVDADSVADAEVGWVDL